MAVLTRVDDEIRTRLRNIRSAKGMRMRDVAKRAGIPVSSYSAIENGYYGLKTSLLYRILEALEADINEVWPCSSVAAILEHRDAPLLRRQELRLHEVVEVFDAESAALFVIEEGRCWPLLTAHLSGEVALRIAFHLERREVSLEGEVSTCEREGREYVLVLDRRRSDLAPELIGFYLEEWARIFSRKPSLLEAAKNRQLQA